MKSKNFWIQQVKNTGVLDPVDRISEILFGLIMVLSFTESISGTHETRPELKHLLWSSLHCNITWGLIDAIMFLLNILIARGHGLKIITSIWNAETKEDAHKILKNEIQPVVAALLTEEDLDNLISRAKEKPLPTKRLLLNSTDFFSALQIFLLVFLCTLPVAMPFAFLNEIELALKISNLTAFALLFFGGYRLGHYAGFSPFLSGFTFAVTGIFLVLLIDNLGG